MAPPNALRKRKGSVPGGLSAPSAKRGRKNGPKQAKCPKAACQQPHVPPTNASPSGMTFDQSPSHGLPLSTHSPSALSSPFPDANSPMDIRSPIYAVANTGFRLDDSVALDPYSGIDQYASPVPAVDAAPSPYFGGVLAPTYGLNNSLTNNALLNSVYNSEWALPQLGGPGYDLSAAAQGVHADHLPTPNGYVDFDEFLHNSTPAADLSHMSLVPDSTQHIEDEQQLSLQQLPDHNVSTPPQDFLMSESEGPTEEITAESNYDGFMQMLNGWNVDESGQEQGGNSTRGDDSSGGGSLSQVDDLDGSDADDGGSDSESVLGSGSTNSELTSGSDPSKRKCNKEIVSNLPYEERPKRRSTTFGKRKTVLIQKAKDLDATCRPFIFLFIAQPESVCMTSGKCHSFASKNMEEVIGDSFATELHQRLMHHVKQKYYDMHDVVTKNAEVQKERSVKEKAEQERKRMEEKQMRSDQTIVELQATVEELTKQLQRD